MIDYPDNSTAVETNAIVWTFVEVGVGVIAACLPTLKPIIDRRTPESIVNSVRSKLSLASDRSTKSRTTGSKPSSHDPDSYEMPIIDKRNGSSADVDSIHHDPPVPPVPQNGILRSHVIDVHEERINNPRNAV